MKQTTLLILFSLLSWTQLSASLDTCYQVVEVISGGSLDIEERVTLDFDANTLLVNEIPFSWSELKTYQTGNRESLVLHFDCIYSFDRFEKRGIFTASTLTVESLGQVIICTHHQSDVAYLIYGGGIYLIVACDSADECISPRYTQPVIANANYTLTSLPQGVEFEISPPIEELISEQLLVQDAYNILTAIEPVYELVTEQRAHLYTNLCPDVEAIPLEVEEEVLVKEAANLITVIPAQFELVTEEVLQSTAYTDVEVVSVPNWDQPYELQITPEYFSYDWIGQSSCLSQNPYDCVEVYTSQSPEQLQLVGNPADWSCGQDIDYSEEMVLVSEVPATYTRRSYYKLKSPATTESVEIPVETKVRTYSTFENLDEIPDSCIQITYMTDTFFRLMIPATTTSQELPAIYETRQYLRTAQEGSFEVDTQEALCELNFEGQQLVSPAMTTYGPYLCEITDVERQEAIKLSLFQAGALDDLIFAYGSGEFWIALFDFQNRRDNWDIGPLTESQAKFLDRP